MTSRYNYVLFSIACLSGIAVRTVMLLFTIDPLSGFIYIDYTPHAIGLMSILCVAGAFVFGLTLFSKINRDSKASLSSLPFQIACSVMAVAIGYETFLSPLLSKSGTVQTYVLYFLAAGAMAALIAVTVFGILKKSFHPAITLLPVAYWTMRLIIVFTDFSTISTISETVIETITMCLTLAVLLFYSKLECDQVKPSRYRFIAATALLNAYLCAVGSVPRIFSTVISLDQPTHMNIIPATTGLATAVFSAVLGFTILHSIKDK